MNPNIEIKGYVLKVTTTEQVGQINSSSGIYRIDANNVFFVKDAVYDKEYKLGLFQEVGINGVLANSFDELETFLAVFFKSVPTEEDGSIPVNLQDQTSRPVIVKFNKVLNSTTLASEALQDATTITLTDVTEVAVGRYLILFNPTAKNYAFVTVTSVLGSPTFTIDTPLDSDFPAGTFVDVTDTNLKSVGSLASPQIYGLRGTTGVEGVDVTLDITRIIFTCTASSEVDLTKFMNIGRLVNGLVLRKRGGVSQNIFNVKDNKEIAALMYDVQIIEAINRRQGVDGLIGRLTFAGQNKMGVAIRLPLGEDLQLLVQDDIQTAQVGDSITKFEITAEGHIVED